jgi:hypothetical protein
MTLEKEIRNQTFYDEIHRILDFHCTGMDDHDDEDCEKCEKMYVEIVQAYKKATS